MVGPLLDTIDSFLAPTGVFLLTLELHSGRGELLDHFLKQIAARGQPDSTASSDTKTTSPNPTSTAAPRRPLLWRQLFKLTGDTNKEQEVDLKSVVAETETEAGSSSTWLHSASDIACYCPKAANGAHSINNHRIQCFAFSFTQTVLDGLDAVADAIHRPQATQVQSDTSQLGSSTTGLWRWKPQAYVQTE